MYIVFLMLSSRVGESMISLPEALPLWLPYSQNVPK